MGVKIKKPDQNITLSKDRILHAAEEIFARKGYDGARVDEIAQKAGVNKALIYYYFKSKEEILHALIHHTVNDLLAELGDNPKNLFEKCIESREAMTDLFFRFLKFLDGHKDLFTILMMELIKDSKNKSMILEHLIKEITRELDPVRKYSIEKDEEQLVITEFFTGFMPVFLFVLLKKAWKGVSGTDEEQLQKKFLKSLEVTHIRYTFETFIKGGNMNGSDK